MKPIRLPTDFELLTEADGYWGRKAYKYAKRRGITDNQIAKFKIGFSEAGDYAYRIVIPIYYKKKLCGIVARAIKDSMVPKYKNSVGEKGLFGAFHLSETAVLVEGVFDALACDRVLMGSGDAIAVLGHSLTERQLGMLDGYKEFILWGDPDAAGIEGFSQIANQLKGVGKVRYVMPRRDDADPDEIPDKERRLRIMKACKWSDATSLRLQAFLIYQE